MYYFDVEFGNAGSRTHEYGSNAKKGVVKARAQVAAVVEAKADEVVFTSGATEADNIAILGLSQFGEASGKKHIVSTQIEHKAVLAPLKEMERRGFELTLVPPNRGGWVEPDAVRDAIRDDTLLVSVMQVNNETGIIQPIDEVAALLEGHDAYFHVDAAQGFGKELAALKNKRIDLISASAHKIHGPKGVGALITRRRKYKRPPLQPLMFGGGQEKGLRPGTLAVPLIAGFGKACEIALRDNEKRRQAAIDFRKRMLADLAEYEPKIIGDSERCIPNILCLHIPGHDSEAFMIANRERFAISNGSACNSSGRELSYVLGAMKVEFQANTIRFSP